MSRANRRRRRKNQGFRLNDIVHVKDGRIGRVLRFASVPNGKRVAFITPNHDRSAPRPEYFTVPVDELRMASVLDQIAWEA